ncbi:hypothetical protein GTP55_22630 [Duganella sp. FT109W]|uniref:Uncharacterized protein n=1 Tax=Duganella margarita TaxID=2692170 RepID=A0A7X4H584_9BURK|nr:hypothetical protein [Duganella margarita]MYM75566.1 hypothetical protein [Duganella margarita]MYN42153.1 hypothetical protein [Duganella margarita]
MTRTIHRNFPQLADAEGARSALLADGFPQSTVKLTTHTALPSDVATSTVGNLLDALTPGGPAAAAAARHRAGAAAMLSVDVYDDDEQDKADRIMGGYGASAA